ncbi:MAG: transcriptional repressor LexA [Angelakisella sp.]
MILSEKAEQVLRYLEKCIEEDGFPPSVREICGALGIKSTSTAHKYLGELQQAGAIQKGNGLNRAIRLSEDRPTGIPLVGVVAAGQPILAVESVECYLHQQVPGYGNDELFALRVRGDSMINAGIFSGDTIIMARTPVARNGEIVVALIDDEATVKRFYKEQNRYRLQPENDTMEPIYTDHVIILGRVVRLLRDF